MPTRLLVVQHIHKENCMTFDEHDAKVGSLLKQKDRAEKKLKNRLCCAKQSVNTLRILADCFDDKVDEAEVVRVMDNRFECVHSSISTHSHLVQPDIKWPEFPPDLRETVLEICDLKADIKRLSELLETELNCF